jgi:hypothetical protein
VSQGEGQTALSSTTDDGSTPPLTERFCARAFPYSERSSRAFVPSRKDGDQRGLMKVVGEAPTGRSIRVIVTEHGMRLWRAISTETECP